MQPTADPDVLIEAEVLGAVRYRSLSTGRRWEVHGVCDYRGDCMTGAVEPWPSKYRDDRFDIPVTPEFSGCCPFTYVELER